MTVCLENAARQDAQVFAPENEETIYGWAEESGMTVDANSPIGGVYRIKNSPWAREWFDAFQSAETRMVTTIGPNQGGRTKAMEVASLWTAKHRPGPAQWNTDTDAKAKDLAEDRWWPMALSCEAIRDKMPTGGTGLGKGRHKERIRKVTFTDGTNFVIQGCGESNAQQKSIMNQFNDEIFQWPIGRLEDFWIRCNVAYAWNYKIWNGSVAGIAGDDSENSFMAGTQEEYHWHCPKCKKAQVPKWGGANDKGGIKFKRILFENGDYDFEAIKKTVFYHCEFCEATFQDSSRTRRGLNAGAKYYAMNPNASREHRSFRFNILSVNWAGLSWGKWVEEFLKATEQWRKIHNAEPLKLFWSRRMAQFWEENKFLNSQRRIVLSDYKLEVPNVYIKTKWENEEMRFMGNDKQEDYYPSVIRAVRKNGESRLIFHGNHASYAEIAERAKEFDVLSNRVILDFGYEIKECAQACVKYGWTGMRGVDSERAAFVHHKEMMVGGHKQIVKVELPWSEAKFKDPMMGEVGQVLNTRIPMAYRQRRLARYFDWMNLPIKNMLSGFKQGSALYWGVPGDVSGEYIKQLNSEVRHKVISAKGKVTYWWSNTNAKGSGTRRPNHAWDCECMIFVAMCMQGLIDLSGWNPDQEKAE